jgi:cold shock CspA family protein
MEPQPASSCILTGTVTSLKKTWGFIRPVDSALDVFFHNSSVAHGTALREGLPVQFQLGTDPVTGRSCALAVAEAAGPVQHEEVAEQDSLGYVLRWPLPTSQAADDVAEPAARGTNHSDRQQVAAAGHQPVGVIR